MTKTRIIGLAACALIALAAFAVVRGSLAGQRYSLGVEIGEGGLKSLALHDISLLADGDPKVTAVSLERPDGSPVEAALTPKDRAFVDGRLSVRYEWGEVGYRYSAADGKLDVLIGVRNTSPFVIRAMTIQLLEAGFPQPPAGWSANLPILTHNVGSPSAIGVDVGVGTVEFSNQEIGRPLIFGFPGRESVTRRPLIVSTGNVGWLSPYLDPQIQRPIYPNGTDQFTLSVCGRQQGATRSPCTDLDDRFGRSFPPTLDWKDRRPIGALFISTPDLNAPGNPRGWFGDRTLQASSEAGRTEFRTRLLDYARRSVQIAKGMNAQGVILWDPEGQEAAHPTSYLCDPRSLPPEIEDGIDEFFAIFARAGLATGLCVRPQRPVRAAYGSAIEQVEVPDIAANLSAKIDYARKRWNSTLFYVDSNGDPNVPQPASVFARVAKAHGDVLILPEHKTVQYHAYTAPFSSYAHHGTTSTPDDVRRVYPAAFSGLYVADSTVGDRQPELVKAVKAGDVLIYHGWYDNPNLAVIRDIYRQAGRN